MMFQEAMNKYGDVDSGSQVSAEDFQTIRITRTLIRDNTHDLNDRRGHSFISDRTGTVVNVQ